MLNDEFILPSGTQTQRAPSVTLTLALTLTVRDADAQDTERVDVLTVVHAWCGDGAVMVP